MLFVLFGFLFAHMYVCRIFVVCCDRDIFVRCLFAGMVWVVVSQASCLAPYVYVYLCAVWICFCFCLISM